MSFFNVPQSDFMPGKPMWLRKLWWFVRNPELHIIPVMNKVDTTTWNPAGGFQRIGNRFISYRGKYIECYLGWRPSGSFGAAFRHANAKGY
jgi:hypothetical protein